jgi:hypothetical protein
MGDADVPGLLAAGLDRHRAPGGGLAQALADRSHLEGVRRRLPPLRRPFAVGVKAQTGGHGERGRFIRDRDPDVQRPSVHSWRL